MPIKCEAPVGVWRAPAAAGAAGGSWARAGEGTCPNAALVGRPTPQLRQGLWGQLGTPTCVTCVCRRVLPAACSVLSSCQQSINVDQLLLRCAHMYEYS